MKMFKTYTPKEKTTPAQLQLNDHERTNHNDYRYTPRMQT